MKNILLTLLSFALFIGFSSAQTTTIKGQIEGAGGKTITVGVGKTRDKVETNSKGEFIYNCNLSEQFDKILVFSEDPRFFSQFVVERGKEASFVYKDKQITFSGANKKLNNYSPLFEQVTGNWAASTAAKHNNFNSFKKEVDQKFAQLSKVLNKAEKSVIRDEYKDRLERTKEASYFQYVWAAQRTRGEGLTADADFVAYAKKVDLNDKRAVNEKPGDGVITALIENKVRWEMAQNPSKYSGANEFISLFNAIKDLVSNKEVASVLVSDKMSLYIAARVDEHLKETADLFSSICINTEKREKIMKQVNDLLALAPGTPAADLTLLDINGKKSKLSDLRGKNIYIDVWATWCGPCVAEIPFVEKLQEKYKESKNLEFVSLSVDDNIEAWKAKINADKPVWKNFVTEDGFMGEVNKKYHISAIPRFMLIDKNGNIVTLNAPRPSSKEIDEFLRPYL